jgi:hypothetical protein
MTEVIGFDVTHANIGSLPPGQQYAGYSTGSPDIRWTPADWAAHPGALRIDQDAAASDGTADYLDIERGAATDGEAAGWYRRALLNYRAGTRPGQRWPGIYVSQGNVTPLVNALIAGGVTSGPKLIIAHWNLPELEPILELARASGPFPLVGFQVLSTAQYDLDLFSAAWLGAVSRPPAVVPPLKAQIQAGLGEAAQDLAELAALVRRLP